MTRVRSAQTSFTAGEISPELHGRSDLRAYENGAARLTNLIVLPTGGVTRRPGLHFVDALPGRARLVAFEFNAEQTYLLAFTDRRLTIYREGAPIAALDSPWPEAALASIAWTQSADTLLVCHPKVAPRRVTRRGELDWRIDPWPLVRDGVSLAPFHRFADEGVTLTAGGTGGYVTATASADIFVQAHTGARLRLGGGQLRIEQVLDGRAVKARVTATLADAGPTADWEESAWSDARGWPATAIFHQSRLAVGGSRDLPNRLWLSRTGDLYNFDLGTGLDDEAIEFPVMSDQVNAIRALHSGRHLQLFTAGGEWMVAGDPLTPATVELRRQTRIGSPVDRRVPPRDVEGATLFVARSGREVREFLYTDLEQAYRSIDLALLARHLVTGPVDQDYDPARRLLMVAMEDGSLAILTAYRAEQVTAWAGWETDGAVGSVATVGDAPHLAVRRGGRWFLEVLSAEVALDAALTGTSDAPTTVWSGLDHLEGRRVRIVADGVERGEATVGAGRLVLDEPARTLTVGLPFTHRIEPLPPALGGVGAEGVALRPVRTVFRLVDTGALRVDAGHGPAAVPLRRLAEGAVLGEMPPPFTGDRAIRHLGWRRGGTAPLWRIVDDAPLPFTLLSATTQLKVND